MAERDEWSDLAAQLAAFPTAWRRLLAEHVPVGDLCRGCGKPGVGTPHLRWPCPLTQLARRAAALHAAATRQVAVVNPVNNILAAQLRGTTGRSAA